MKKVLAIVALVLATLLAYNYATTGRMTLLPSSELPAADREIENLRIELQKAVALLQRAGRDAGIGAVDTTADAGAAQAEIERIEGRFADIERRGTVASKDRLDRLRREIEAAKRAIR